jgi:hypothetical protein
VTRERFQSILRRTLYSTLSVRRDSAWACRHGFHPDALQVWDEAPVSGEPYVVFVCQRKGAPIEPTQEMVDAIQAMAFSRVQGSLKAWAEDAASSAFRENEAMERRRAKAFRERFDWDFVPKVEWMTHNHRTFGLNKTQVPS